MILHLLKWSHSEGKGFLVEEWKGARAGLGAEGLFLLFTLQWEIGISLSATHPLILPNCSLVLTGRHSTSTPTKFKKKRKETKRLTVLTIGLGDFFHFPSPYYWNCCCVQEKDDVHGNTNNLIRETVHPDLAIPGTVTWERSNCLRMMHFKMSQWKQFSGLPYRLRWVTAFRTVWDFLWDTREEHFGIGIFRGGIKGRRLRWFHVEQAWENGCIKVYRRLVAH